MALSLSVIIKVPQPNYKDEYNMENIIPYEFYVEQVKSLSFSQIKSILSRSRLKFSKELIAKYLYLLDFHNYHKISLLDLYNKQELQENIDCCYSNFCRNLDTISKLMPYIFNYFNSKNNIKKTSNYGIVDTTIIEKKKSSNILESDFTKNDVTSRFKNKCKSHKIYYCGYKLLCFLNENKLCYGLNLLNINYSDMNILKDSALYKDKVENIKILADRGIGHNKTKKRLLTFNSELIFPKRKSQQKNKDDWIDEKHKVIYKNRWKIEMCFNEVKNPYGIIRLDLTYKKLSESVRKAKIYLSLLKYNLQQLGLITKYTHKLDFT